MEILRLDGQLNQPQQRGLEVSLQLDTGIMIGNLIIVADTCHENTIVIHDLPWSVSYYARLCQ